MDPSTGAPSPDKLAMESSFRKLSADAANSKYRRHRSSSNSDSSSAEDSPERERSSKRGRSRSPVQHKEGHSKETENLQKKDDTRDPVRGSSHSRSDKCHESHRHSERHSYGASRESKRHDDYRRYHDRHADEDERSYPRSSRSARESRPDGYSDRARRDSISDRSRGNWLNVDNYHGEKSDNSEYRSKNKEKEAYSTRDHANNRERERHKYRSLEGEKRDHYRIPGKYKDDYASTRDKYKRYLEEKEKTKTKETIEQEAAARRKRNGKESEKRSYGSGIEGELKDERRSLFSSVGPDVKKEQYLEGNSGKATIGSSEDDKPKQVSEVHDRATSNSFNSSSNESGASEDVNAAKVAAMKAAALVNRNIVGFGGVGVGHLSTDQKKKLLWGNKKNNAAEETTKHWDLNLFSDRERQEKFNKLMSLRMPWCLWPIVGCEGQCCSREQDRERGWRPGRRSQEAGGARYGLGEALHSWPSSERWSDCWSRALVIPAYTSYDNETLERLLCTHFIGLITLCCRSFITFLLSDVKSSSSSARQRYLQLGSCNLLVCHVHLRAVRALESLWGSVCCI